MERNPNSPGGVTAHAVAARARMAKVVMLFIVMMNEGIWEPLPRVKKFRERQTKSSLTDACIYTLRALPSLKLVVEMIGC